MYRDNFVYGVFFSQYRNNNKYVWNRKGSRLNKNWGET